MHGTEIKKYILNLKKKKHSNNEGGDYYLKKNNLRNENA